MADASKAIELDPRYVKVRPDHSRSQAALHLVAQSHGSFPVRLSAGLAGTAQQSCFPDNKALVPGTDCCPCLWPVSAEESGQQTNRPHVCVRAAARPLRAITEPCLAQTQHVCP